MSPQAFCLRIKAFIVLSWALALKPQLKCMYQLFLSNSILATNKLIWYLYHSLLY